MLGISETKLSKKDLRKHTFLSIHTRRLDFGDLIVEQLTRWQMFGRSKFQPAITHRSLKTFIQINCNKLFTHTCAVASLSIVL